MDESYEEYLEDVIEIAEAKFELSKEEIVYNNEHFENCFEEGMSAEDSVQLLSDYSL
tara:strand:+ start:255 stop:425 length:171 start_codon:yes stop_codon:yes gene_type:complete